MNNPRLYIRTFGCQMNVYDSSKIQGMFENHHFTTTDDPHLADVVLINTCSVRDKSEQKFYSELGRWIRKKRKRPHLIIGVGGCVAQQEGEKLLQRFPGLDIVFGTKTFYDLPVLVDKVKRGQGAFCIVEREDESLEPWQGCPLPGGRKSSSAFVSIMRGCNNFCSFCVVPYVRGPEWSRPVENVLGEISKLIEQGVKEVTLLGQNVNSYGQTENGRVNFPQLLHLINDMEGLERIRFTTSHPKDLSEELIMAFPTLGKLCEHIHLPAQTGSNRILERMNRGYTREEYLEKIYALSEACPGIGITSDLMVGFPGESEEDFEQTLALTEEVQFDSIYSFKFSPRPQTEARNFSEQLSDEIKQLRLERLQRIQEKITTRKLKEMVGNRVEVLVERNSRITVEELTGRTRRNYHVNFPGSDRLIGSTVNVHIERANAHSLWGTIHEEIFS